ncbi:MAG: hypothetical protein HY913_04520 [Desulfomonile tiedjei]|nr:hypothetical protein [Desulfomonile tiedjei]
MKHAIILLLSLLLLASCATRTEIVRGARITLPQLPQRVDIEQQGQHKDKDTIYLSPPTELKPDQNWRAPSEGAVVWKNKDLRGILYGLREWQRWGLDTRDIVEQHNKIMDKTTQAAKPWYKLW